MPRLRFTVTTKITLVYLTTAVTSLASITAAVVGLRRQTETISHLVAVEFRASGLARDLRENLLAQEVLDKQWSVLGSPELIELLGRRERDFDLQWHRLEGLSTAGDRADLRQAVATYREWRARVAGPGGEGRAAAVPADALAGLSHARAALMQRLIGFRDDQNQHLDSALTMLSTESGEAYRRALVLVVLGLLLGVPVAVWVALSIHRSIKRLLQATRAIGEGKFEVDLQTSGSDELARLAQAFREMGRKLRDLEQVRLDANPLTHLPGNLALDRELERRIAEGVPFAHAYIDLDNFKIYNDRYGYQRGNDVIAFVGDLIRDTVAAFGTPADLIGHIGGDDYVLLSTPERVEEIARQFIDRFDREIPAFYAEEDRARGFIEAKDRFGVERKIPLMSVSVAVVRSDNFSRPTAAAIARECARMKEHLKNRPGSNYLVDRRRGA